MKSEFILLLETIEKDKGIPREEILRLIEGALVSALHKHLGRDVPVQASMNGETGEVHAAVMKKVVEHVGDSLVEISLDEAKKHNAQANLGEEIPVTVDTMEFSRIAAQAAKQVILQKLREVEKENLFKDFKKKENLIITGSVYRVGHDRTVYVSLGKIEAILKKDQQIPGERFSIGQPLKAMVCAVESSAKGPQVYLSRSAPGFVQGLLRFEVPEIHNGIVEISKVVREAGFRSKVLVKSHDERVDPVGACVGIKGTRIRPVINELHGEKIDLVVASLKTEEMLSTCLAPAQVVRVEVEDAAKKTAKVYVQSDEMAGAIGKDGINLKLASELSGWKIAVEPVKPAADQIKTGASAGEGVSSPQAGEAADSRKGVGGENAGKTEEPCERSSENKSQDLGSSKPKD